MGRQVEKKIELKDSLKKKLSDTRKQLRELGSVLVAFSGGVDSTLLLYLAKEGLGTNAVAATAASCLILSAELDEAKRTARQLQVEHIIVALDPLADPDFTANTAERCYFCKHGLLTKFGEIAVQKGLAFIIDGTNFDDLHELRPGRRASEELGVRSPLAEAGLTKDDIRFLANYFGLPVWNKPPSPCLATRIPTGQVITEEKLRLIEYAESSIKELGFRQVRVRLHSSGIARIEIERSEIASLLGTEETRYITSRLKNLGFKYVTLDLEGYRSSGGQRTLDERD